jgi:acetylornithine deacetylase/succinyl-diaminopimelate desuccinylase-like protein
MKNGHGHFSLGGSDDGASCAIMLEILQIITQMDHPLKHNLILLFNGAEENLMQVTYRSLYSVS